MKDQEWLSSSSRRWRTFTRSGRSWEGKASWHWWHHTVPKAGTGAFGASFCWEPRSVTVCCNTAHTSTESNPTLWMGFFCSFLGFFFFRLNVLTVFPVSFLATRTTKGMFALSLVDRYPLCPCFRLEFRCSSGSQLGVRILCCCHHRQNFHLAAVSAALLSTALSSWLQALTSHVYMCLQK